MTTSLAPPPTRVPARPWQKPASLGATALAGTVVLGVVDPNTTHVPLCPLKALTGIDCPLCGSLRAVHSLTRLDLVGALDHNLLFTLSVPALVLGWTVWLLRSLGRPVLPTWRWPRAGPAVILTVALVFAVLRNLPGLGWLGSG